MPDRLKPFLLHQDPHVRRAVVDYFADSWSRDPDLIPLILDACERFGDGGSSWGISALSRFPMDDSSLDRVLRHLARARDPDAIHRLNRVIAHAPGDLLAARHAEVLAHPEVSREIVPQAAWGRKLAGWGGERPGVGPGGYARRSEAKRDTGGIDHGYVAALVDALARRDVPDDATVCHLLRSLK